MPIDQAVAEWTRLLRMKEELHPDLQACVGNSGLLGKVLQHPLLYNVPHHDEMNALLNRRYQYLRERAQQFLDTGEYSKYIYLHEKPYRLEALIEVGANMSDQDYWETVGNLWVYGVEFTHTHLDGWVELWRSDRAGREFAMDDADREALNTLPERVELYRGANHADAFPGLSWTSDRDKARQFALRWVRTGRKGYLARMVIPRSDITAYYVGRGESEAIVLPEHHGRMEIERIVRE